MENLLKDLGNYMISVQIDKNKEIFIHGSIINHPNKKDLLKIFREENINENKTEEITLPDGTKKTNVCYSQVREWITFLNLKDDQITYDKLKEYLNELLKYKN